MFNELKTKKDRTAHIREMLATDARWALKALVRIYDNQTADEKSSEDTKHDNGIGFTGSDAHLLTSYAKQYNARGSLSPKQMTYVFKKMPKYARQLERVSK